MCKILDYVLMDMHEEKSDGISDGITYSCLAMLIRLNIHHVVISWDEEFIKKPRKAKRCDVKVFMEKLKKRNSTNKVRRKSFEDTIKKIGDEIGLIFDNYPKCGDEWERLANIMKPQICLFLYGVVDDKYMNELEKCINKKQYICIPCHGITVPCYE